MLENQHADLTRDDVGTALALLNVQVGVEERVGMEDLYAGLTLLGFRTSVRVETLHSSRTFRSKRFLFGSKFGSHIGVISSYLVANLGFIPSCGSK